MSEQPLRVLLVEDDEEDFMIARDLFKEIPHDRYDLDWIDNYEEALDEILAQRHDIYLLDYHLGPHDGLELLQEALAEGCNAPMIILTGQGGRDVDLEAMRLGAYDYLIKGQITPQVLERSIRYALAHARSTDALRETVRISSALLTVANHIHEGVAITDPFSPDNPVIYLNDRYAGMTGYARDELLGRNLRVLQGAQTDPAEIERMRQAIDEARPYHGTIVNYRADDTPFLCELSIYPVRDSDGEVVKYVALASEPDAGSPT